ncbi:outer membrane beta-barrel protein [Bosea sp. LjRoot9]|uniref:outer membrane protein n=1 Tax=Bosea sp. LjRoot9 TaxID=3342341 RepID=UPI003ECEE4FA
MSFFPRACLAFVALNGLAASAAIAADLPSNNQVPVYTARAPAFTWTGFYVGANAGYGARVGKDYAQSVQPGYFPGAPRTSGTITSERTGDGIIGGAQIGYNYQMGNWVFGIENDIQYMDLGKKKSGYSFAGSGSVPAGFDYNGPEKTVDWFATGRGRIGYAFDNLLVYATAGLTYSSLKSENCTTGKCDTNKIGYVGGAGVEYAFTPNWTVRVEGLYVNLGKASAGAIGTDASGRVYTGSATKIDNDIALVRAGVNYKF